MDAAQYRAKASAKILYDLADPVTCSNCGAVSANGERLVCGRCYQQLTTAAKFVTERLTAWMECADQRARRLPDSEAKEQIYLRDNYGFLVHFLKEALAPKSRLAEIAHHGLTGE